MGFQAVDAASGSDIVFSRYPVRVKNKQRLLEAAERNTVEIGDWMTAPLHQAAAAPETWDYRPGMCPEGEKAAREVINLPTHRRVDESEALRVLEFLQYHAIPA
jgi:dTDP-4-amino-4,6-dideoxygalactose transaminase